MRTVTIFSKPEKNLEVAIAFMRKANECRALFGATDWITKMVTKKFYESIPYPYQADFGLHSDKYCIIHPKYGTIAM